mgnify:FL=1
MIIEEVIDKKQKMHTTANILKSLPDWFGIPESIQEFIDKSSNLPFF